MGHFFKINFSVIGFELGFAESYYISLRVTFSMDNPIFEPNDDLLCFCLLSQMKAPFIPIKDLYFCSPFWVCGFEGQKMVLFSGANRALGQVS